jgi:hypothetical protein
MSGRVLGAHQKIDRLARRSLGTLLASSAQFPANKLILHFEGVNGPDAIKRKSPAHDEPWHYYDPFDKDDTQLVTLIGDHYDCLAAALKEGDDVRAAFEAAWLAHAIVDGLTPAHHYPYEEKLAELRGGRGLETRDTIKDKIIMPGRSAREQIGNNWKMWGPKGLLMSHGFFEFGIAFLVKPVTKQQIAVRDSDLAELREYGVLELFKRRAREISTLDMYETYQKNGWTPKLARQVRLHLVPAIVRTVTLAWYAACIDAGLTQKALRP